MTPTGVLIPTSDMDAAVTFLRDVVRLPLKFRDGDRYCAFQLGDLVLALVGEDERIVPAPALTVRAEDLAGALAAAVAGGGRIERPPERGPHEHRAVVEIPGGGLVVLSAKLAAA